MTACKKTSEPITAQFQLQVLEFLVAMYRQAWPPPMKPLFPGFFQVEEVELEIERLKRHIQEQSPDVQADPLPAHCGGI
jgi:hypothetical protein